MASTVLPNGIIIPEKYSRDWYNDLYHNWQELDNLLGGGTPKDGTLTIQKNGTTVGTFSANQATDETVNIEVPDVNNGTLTIQKNGTTVGTFSANQATDETINITVPDVNDATLTIQQNGTTVDTFTANSSTDKTVNIAIPTKTSDLTNDSNFVPSTDLANVATSGNYNDLSNKPTIPTVNNATLTIQKNGTNVQTFTANQSTNATANITVPTKTSDLTNDSGFITSDNTKIPLSGSNQISGDLIPSSDGTVNLGSSSKKFASLNSIAPDELGLPSSTYTDVSSYITHFDMVTPNHFTAPVSGLLYIQGNGPTTSECTVNNDTKKYNVIIPYGFGCIRGLVPVNQGDEIYIHIAQLTNLADAKIFHLKGKV